MPCVSFLLVLISWNHILFPQFFFLRFFFGRNFLISSIFDLFLPTPNSVQLPSSFLSHQELSISLNSSCYLWVEQHLYFSSSPFESEIMAKDCRNIIMWPVWLVRVLQMELSKEEECVHIYYMPPPKSILYLIVLSNQSNIKGGAKSL